MQYAYLNIFILLFFAKYTTSHFLPSLVNTGDLSIGALAGNTVFIGAALTAGALNGAGPDLNAGFLCVCISEVTFFKPAIQISNNTYKQRLYAK